MTAMEETGDGFTATTDQTATTRQQEETHIEPQVNHRPPTEQEEPNSQPRRPDFGLGVDAHQPFVSSSFQVAWFDSWRWLHYVEDTNWKTAARKKAGFSQHERCQCHREVVERSITLHAKTMDVGEHI